MKGFIKYSILSLISGLACAIWWALLFAKVGDCTDADVVVAVVLTIVFGTIITCFFDEVKKLL
ncbi:hypothetical protein [Treponema socranskii]|uniref:hypothetical protein n=1 Tax=Treponema socranskii TaxID=53419 RepID=UPI003D6DC953